MADVVEERINIQDEETDFESAVSEGTLQRISAAINFINKRQTDQLAFKFLNELGTFTIDLSFVDGAMAISHDAEIVGYTMWISQFGSGTGSLDIDILRLQNSGDAGTTIFSTRPVLAPAAGNNSWITKVTVPTAFTKNPASGYTHGVFSTTNLNQGDILVAKLKSVPSEGIDAGLTLFLRPR